MRTFKQHLKEFWGAGEVSSGQLQAGHLSMAVEDPVVIDAINAYLCVCYKNCWCLIFELLRYKNVNQLVPQ